MLVWIGCLIGDMSMIDVNQDARISGIPLFIWPTFVIIEVVDNLRISNLLADDGWTWRA